LILALISLKLRSPHLILLIGLPASGKSSVAKQISASSTGKSQIISTDAIRADLYGDEEIQGEWWQIQELIEQQFKLAVEQIESDRLSRVIYDATNTIQQYRKEAIALARQTGFNRITGFWVNTPLAICWQRNCQRKRIVPEEILLEMDCSLKEAPPTLEDGFDRLIYYLPISDRSHRSRS
jgi:predicted kinase